MKKVFLVVLIIILALAIFLTYSKKKAEQVALPVMERCWRNDSIEIVSLTTRLNFRQGLNWRAGIKYTLEGFPDILENTEYGYVPEILVNIFTGKIILKHFQEIGDPDPGC